MEAKRESIFENPDGFDSYCDDVARRLQSRRERAEFLRRGVERLEGLHRVAHEVEDEATARELEEQMRAARSELEVLRVEAARTPEANAGTERDPPAASPQSEIVTPRVSPGAVEAWMQSLPEPSSSVAAPEAPVESSPISPVSTASSIPAVAPWNAAGAPGLTATAGFLNPFSGSSDAQAPGWVPSWPPTAAPPLAPSPPPAVPEPASTTAPELAAPTPPKPPAAFEAPAPAAAKASEPVRAGSTWDLDFVTEALTGSTRALGSQPLQLDIRIGQKQFVWTASGGSARIGRRDPASRTRPDIDLSPDIAVSRSHARLTFRTGQYYLVDLNSTNGTEVNGEYLPPNVEVEVHPGDEIVLGEQTRIHIRTGH